MGSAVVGKFIRVMPELTVLTCLSFRMRRGEDDGDSDSSMPEIESGSESGSDDEQGAEVSG